MFKKRAVSNGKGSFFQTLINKIVFVAFRWKYGFKSFTMKVVNLKMAL